MVRAQPIPHLLQLEALLEHLAFILVDTRVVITHEVTHSEKCIYTRQNKISSFYLSSLPSSLHFI